MCVCGGTVVLKSWSKMDYAASTMFDSLKNNRISKLALSKFLSQSLWVKYTIAIQKHEIGLTLEIMRVTASIVTLCIQLIAFIASAICGFRVFAVFFQIVSLTVKKNWQADSNSFVFHFIIRYTSRFVRIAKKILCTILFTLNSRFYYYFNIYSFFFNFYYYFYIYSIF